MSSGIHSDASYYKNLYEQSQQSSMTDLLCGRIEQLEDQIEKGKPADALRTLLELKVAISAIGPAIDSSATWFLYHIAHNIELREEIHSLRDELRAKTATAT